MKETKPKLVQTRHGYWTYSPKPTLAELQAFYKSRYFQEGCGGYEKKYSETEIQYYRLKAALIIRNLKRILRWKKRLRVLDVGCGEGWLMNKFYNEGAIVHGIDFSSFAIEKFHPHLITYFEQGNIYEMLEKKITDSKPYDVISLSNVLEHVIDPEELLRKLKKLLNKTTGILIIVVPNDFSKLHKHLLENKFIDHPFWLAYPEHLSYFNQESMNRLLKAMGFRLKSIIADNPVDLNLLNDNSNYIKEMTKGKNIHLFRVRSDNFLASISEDRLLDLYTVYGKMGIGRDLSFFCKVVS